MPPMITVSSAQSALRDKESWGMALQIKKANVRKAKEFYENIES